MKCLVIYSHPNSKSFNHAVKEEVLNQLKKRGDEVVVRDLYEIGFNPVLSLKDFESLGKGEVPADIKKEQEFLQWAEAVIVVHPTWWNSFPAMLKGYFDKILLPGFAYKYGENGVIKLLSGRKGIIFRTSGSDLNSNINDGRKVAYETTSDYGTIGFCGIELVSIETFWAAPFVEESVRKGYLEKIKESIAKL